MKLRTALRTDPGAQTVALPNNQVKQMLFERDALMKRLEQEFQPYKFQVSAVPEGVQIDGDDVAVTLCSRVLTRVAEALKASGKSGLASLDATVSAEIENALKRDLAFRLEGLFHPVQPMSLAQVAFMDGLLNDEEELVLGVGSTGTGKTHLSLAAGLSLLAKGRVKQIVVTRPHVLIEGEAMTPGLRQDLVYEDQFTAIEDVLHDLIGIAEFDQLIEDRKLLLTPLGRMRGRTFNHSFIIVDEAQNMTVRKMRMVTTRIGRDSRMVVIGDPAQVDLRTDEPSGLGHLLNLIEGTDIAGVHRFGTNQIIRNDIVARLEKLYARDD